MQRCDLGLWNGSNDSYRNNSAAIGDVVKSSVVAATGSNNIEEDQSAGNQQLHPAPTGALSMLIEQSDTMLLNDVAAGNQLTTQDSTQVKVQHKSARDQPPVSYVNAAFGLFPSPLGRAAKSPQISRLKTKFKFLGKFMAKAVMDSRMVSIILHFYIWSIYEEIYFLKLDLPCSIPFYRWLLSEEHSLGLADLAFVAPEVQATLIRLHELVKRRDTICQDASIDVSDKTEQVRQLIRYVCYG